MNEADKLFDLMSQMYNDMQDMKTDIKDVKERVINIENNHGKKLTALFDGYVQQAEQLNRIEKEVSKHEEIILRRVK
jgi:predicted nuclease with TOPRIM domain